MSPKPIDRETFHRQFAVRLLLQACCLGPLYFFFLHFVAKGQVTLELGVLGVSLVLALFVFQPWDLVFGRLRHLFPKSEPPNKKALRVVLYLPVSCVLFYLYLGFANQPRDDDQLPFLFRRARLCAFLLLLFNFTFPVAASFLPAQKAEKLGYWESSPFLFAIGDISKDVQFSTQARESFQKDPSFALAQEYGGHIQSGVGRLMAMTVLVEQNLRQPAGENPATTLKTRAQSAQTSVAILQKWDHSAPLISRMNPIFAISPTALPEAIIASGVSQLVDIYTSLIYLEGVKRQIDMAALAQVAPEKITYWKTAVATTNQAQLIKKNEATWVGRFFPQVRAKLETIGATPPSPSAGDEDF